MGQPHFFRPRPLNPLFAPAGPPTSASFYDTTPMIETLRRLVDFDLINAGPVRLTLGATDVETGQVVFFDSANRQKPIGPAHVLASGSLPPGFPATEIDGRFYWDGGCVSNTPAEAVLDDQPQGHTLLFLIDLWNAAGPAPTTMSEVLWRAKQIQYASRGHLLAEHLAVKANLRQRRRGLAARREGAGRRPTAGAAEPHGHGRLDIFHIIYQPGRGPDPEQRRRVLPRLDRGAARGGVPRHAGAAGAAALARLVGPRGLAAGRAARCCTGCGRARSKPASRLDCIRPRRAWPGPPPDGATSARAAGSATCAEPRLGSRRRRLASARQRCLGNIGGETGGGATRRPSCIRARRRLSLRPKGNKT